MINNNAACCNCASNCTKPLCWSAILAGALIGLGLSFLLGLFGTAIGLTAFNISENGAIVLAVGGVVGIVIGVIVSMAAGGYAAGYLGKPCGSPSKLGLIYGFTTWSLSLILSAFIMAQMGHYAAAYSKSISNAVEVKLQKPQQEVNSSIHHLVKPAAIQHDQKKTYITLSADNLVMNSCIIFVLFFIGALASCFGAYGAIRCRCAD